MTLRYVAKLPVVLPVVLPLHTHAMGDDLALQVHPETCSAPFVPCPITRCLPSSLPAVVRFVALVVAYFRESIVGLGFPRDGFRGAPRLTRPASSPVYSCSFSAVSEGVLHHAFWYFLSP
jgi:hypothetical protein